MSSIVNLMSTITLHSVHQKKGHNNFMKNVIHEVVVEGVQIG